jgi:hypothetical protein
LTHNDFEKAANYHHLGELIMQSELLKTIWAEICFILSENINSNVSESIYEQAVLRAIEKLGWSQFRKEIVIQPSLQIGRQGSIRPDIVIYGPEKKALIVIEVKRPSEDMAKDSAIGQLKSYMRQMKADFGLLVGIELRVFYDGNLNPQTEPLLLEKIAFDHNSSAGFKFIEIFYKNNFLENKYISSLKETIGKFNKNREVKKLRKTLCSTETKDKIFEFLKNEYTDFGHDIIETAIENLKIELSYDSDSVKLKDYDIGHRKLVPDPIHLYKNKSSGEKFIFIENIETDKVRLITPQGEIKSLEINFFEEYAEKSEAYLLSHKLITKKQIDLYHSVIEDESRRNQPVKRKYIRGKVSSRRSGGGRALGSKGYENLKDYLIPVIKLMKEGYSHQDAFHKIKDDLGVRYNTVSAQCTRGLVNTDQFVSFVGSGEIVQFLKNSFPDRIELIEYELGV